MPENPNEQQIRERAYQIYFARGGKERDGLSDWLTAERELKESAQRQATKKRAATASL